LKDNVINNIKYELITWFYHKSTVLHHLLAHVYDVCSICYDKP
jgi:hypothetical protein